MIHQAFLFNYAMNDPKPLMTEQQKYLHRLNRDVTAPAADPVADARAQMAAAHVD